MRHNSPIQVNE